ncbi:Na+/melibiose symporter-like transporter [Lipingzhangella halophila]|uniref:Na+/melibiose symporter-like transporter n=1 Tax=Lipingzhangella halophila TaxID=1783352 RepID=A0A7W7RJX7_9ACTN|nr:Na+/melibiose symporter-like transporter [Lipingzhangella halophila]
MIVAASMPLLSDARQGRRGGVLPWTLLAALPQCHLQCVQQRSVRG